MNRFGRFASLVLAALALATLLPPARTAAQTTPAAAQQKHITPAEAKKLFSLVDELLRFSSQETGLAIQAPVKRQLITRPQIEAYLRQKFAEDKSSQRLERDEVLLKKFGLLDRDFDLQPFLLSLLTEQVEGFYDEKTQTVHLLDWVEADEQKSVLAHELTHALQDQHIHLEKWSDQTPDQVSHNAAEDTGHIARDEFDTAREAVTEGQATAVMTDYMLKPMGKSLLKDPEVVELLRQQMGTSSDSPVMSRAPLLLSESMLFPYRDGLGFEQDIWMDKGRSAAFAQMLDQPPSSSWEILNPLQFERGGRVPIPFLPNIHPLVDPLYTPFDIGQFGQLDTKIFAKILGGEKAASALTPAWNGGIYWAGQLKSTAAGHISTASLATLYLSDWKNAASAETFARLYADNLGRKYSQLQDEGNDNNGRELVRLFSTAEGPVLVVRRGPLVFISESFPLPLARQLSTLLLDAQGSGEQRLAQNADPTQALGRYGIAPRPSLTADLVRLGTRYGTLKVVAQAETRIARQGAARP